MTSSQETIGSSRSADVYARLRAAILHGDFAPEDPLKPQHLATSFGVSLAVVRESLLRLVGEGLATRLQNKGFAVPAVSADRWQQIAEARAAIESSTLALALARGDLAWEARVRSSHHVLAGTPMYDDGQHASDAWSDAHRVFHRSLLEGCGNPVLLESFDRLWTASELARRWSVAATPRRDVAGEHAALEAAALARDTDAAVDILRAHLGLTVEVLQAERAGKEAG